jgi:hypothetical protein
MAITLIGQSAKNERAESKLPTVELELGSPSSAPEAQRLFDDARLTALAAHPHALVRELVVSRLDEPKAADAHRALLEALARDADERVAALALEVLSRFGDARSLELAVERFRAPSAAIAGAAAALLGRLDPDRLLAESKSRPRLDDALHARVMTAYARAESEAVTAELSKALNRAGVLSPLRRASLYAAALLTGQGALAGRVIGVAIDESRLPADDEAAGLLPGRAALVALAGLDQSMASVAVGEQVLASLEASVGRGEAAWTRELDPQPLRVALQKKAWADALQALAPALDRAVPPGASEEQAAVVRRRRGALQALVQARAAIASLPAGAAALFLSAAVSAAELVLLASRRAEDSPSIQTLARFLEVEPSYLLGENAESLAIKLTAEGERRLRQVAGILSRESTYEGGLFDRLLDAVVSAGGAAPLFDAAATSNSNGFVLGVLRALVRFPAQSEAAVVAALEERPLDARRTALALRIGSAIATERVVRAIGRRFYELRAVDRLSLVESVTALADPRLLPALASRAYRDEPERMPFVLTSLVAGAAVEGAVAEALADVEGRARDVEEDGIRVLLACKACGERLSYLFERIYVDPKARGHVGDDRGDDGALDGGARGRGAIGADARRAARDPRGHRGARDRAGAPERRGRARAVTRLAPRAAAPWAPAALARALDGARGRRGGARARPALTRGARAPRRHPHGRGAARGGGLRLRRVARAPARAARGPALRGRQGGRGDQRRGRAVRAADLGGVHPGRRRPVGGAGAVDRGRGARRGGRGAGARAARGWSGSAALSRQAPDPSSARPRRARAGPGALGWVVHPT